MPSYTRIIRRTLSQTEGWFGAITSIGKAERARKKKAKQERVSIGIDPSLTGTGLSVFHNGKLTDFRSWTNVVSLQKKQPQHLIFCNVKKHTAANTLGVVREIGAWVGSVLSRFADYDLVVAMEGYALHSKGRGISDLHELGGYIKQAMLTLGIPFRIYDPLSIKLAATGDGSADKGTMKIACLKKLDLDVTCYGKAGENIADACMIGWLLEQERAIRDGRVKLKKAAPDTRKVLLRTTKTQPEALISQPWIHEESIELGPLRYD